MRVLLISHRFPPDAVAGVERYVEMLARELVLTGEAVHVVSRRPEQGADRPRILKDEDAHGAAVWRLEGGRSRRDRFLAGHQQLDALFESILLEAVPDVVHVNHLIDLSPRFINLAHRFGAAVVLSLHDYYFACPRIILKKPDGSLCRGPRGGRECADTCFADEGASAHLRWGLRTAYFRRLLAEADQVVCPSEYLGEFFERHVPEACIEVIPNGIAFDRPSLTPPQSWDRNERDRLRIAYLGSIVPHKGIHNVLEAIRIAGISSTHLRVLGHLGDAGYARKLRAQAAEVRGLTLTFYGSYEFDEVPTLLHDVDCVVVPSIWPETFSLVTRESLALGIPVVVSDLGAPREAVLNGQNGFTYAYDRPEELAAVLRQLASDPELRARLRAGARSTPVTSAQEHAQMMRGVYARVIDKRRRSRKRFDGVQAESEFFEAALTGLGFGELDEHTAMLNAHAPMRDANEV